MHSRRSVLNTLLLTGALAFAPSLASAQDTGAATSAGGSVTTGGGGPSTAQTKTASKKKDTKKKKKSKSDKDEDGESGGPQTAQITTKIDQGTPDQNTGNPSVVIAPGPTAQGPGVVDNGSGGGGTTDTGGSGGTGTGGGTPAGPGGTPVVPPPVSPDM